MSALDDYTASRYLNAERSICDWLALKRTTLWGSTWTVTDERGREDAARWFRSQMEDWVRWTEEEKEKGDG